MSDAKQKDIRICNQPYLGAVRTAQIAADGVRYRLFRASVTVCVIAVAVAFLMNIMGESLVKRRLAHDARLELAEMRSVHEWAARLSRPSAPEETLAAAGTDAASPFVSVLGDDNAVQRFDTRAQAAHDYLEFFDGLKYDPRRRLIFNARGVGIFDYLLEPAKFDAFVEGLAQMPAVRFVGPVPEFRHFLDEWPALWDMLARIAEAERAGIAPLDAVRGERTMFKALAAPDAALFAAARQVGFQISRAEQARLATQAQTVLDGLAVERTLSLMETRKLLARHFDLLPADVCAGDLWQFLSGAKHAAAFLDTIGPLTDALQGYRAERLVALAQMHRREVALERLERLTAGTGGGWLGLGERLQWLLSVSLLVCAIGISNAMLMTVTERFREIATMKCLGALDGFIMLLFVLEACFLGFVGGILGVLLGYVISFGRMAIIFGPRVFASVPLGEIAAAMCGGIGVGVLLAAAAAVYPSLKAARLAPMEAMRVE